MGLEERAQEREIDGRTYRVLPIPFGKGRALLVRVLQLLRPLLASSGGGEALASLIGELNDADLKLFAEAFGNASFVADGQGNWMPLVPQNQELHFAGRYGEFLRWLTFCLEVNYGSFFAGLKNGPSADGLLARITGKP